MDGTAITQVMAQATSLEIATMRGMLPTSLRGKAILRGKTILSGRKVSITCPCQTGRTKAINTTRATGKDQHLWNQASTSRDYQKSLSLPQWGGMMQAGVLADPQSLLAEDVAGHSSLICIPFWDPHQLDIRLRLSLHLHQSLHTLQTTYTLTSL